jgi:hypothetical protein
MIRNRQLIFDTNPLEARDLPSSITPKAPCFKKPEFAPPGIVISPIQMANLQELGNDLAAIHGQSDATPEQWASFFQTGAAVLDGASKPSSASVSLLAADYKLFSADGNISEIEQKKLDKDVDNVLASANIPRAEWDAFVDAALELHDASNTTTEQLQELKNDLIAVVNEFYVQHPSAPKP